MQVRDLGFQMFYFFHIVWTLKDCLLFPLRISREWWWHFIPIIWFFCLVFSLTNRDESVLILLLSLKSHFLSVIFFLSLLISDVICLDCGFFFTHLKFHVFPFPEGWNPGITAWDLWNCPSPYTFFVFWRFLVLFLHIRMHNYFPFDYILTYVLLTSLVPSFQIFGNNWDVFLLRILNVTQLWL